MNDQEKHGKYQQKMDSSTCDMERHPS